MQSKRKWFGLVLLLLGTSVSTPTNAEPSTGASCRQAFLEIDDRANTDIEALSRLIAVLDSEIADPALALSGETFISDLRRKLDEAKRQRAARFDQQHEDRNVIRVRCARERKENPDFSFIPARRRDTVSVSTRVP